jgi:hypothetical protein
VSYAAVYTIVAPKLTPERAVRRRIFPIVAAVDDSATMGTTLDGVA